MLLKKSLDLFRHEPTLRPEPLLLNRKQWARNELGNGHRAGVSHIRTKFSKGSGTARVKRPSRGGPVKREKPGLFSAVLEVYTGNYRILWLVI